MTLDRRFQRAKITKIGTAFELRVTYSYYSLYEYEEVSVHTSLQQAKDRLLIERCGSNLIIDAAA